MRRRERSKRVAVGFPGPDAQRVIERRNEDLAVADLAGARIRGDDVDRLLREIGRDGDLDAQFRQEIHDIFGAAVDLGVTLLAAIALDLCHRHSMHADCGQGLAHLVKFERFDDRDDELHGRAVPYLVADWVDSRAQEANSDIFLGKWHKEFAARLGILCRPRGAESKKAPYPDTQLQPRWCSGALTQTSEQIYRLSRTEPSCATEAISVPSGLKIRPRVSPRPACALGESCA